EPTPTPTACMTCPAWSSAGVVAINEPSGTGLTSDRGRIDDQQLEPYQLLHQFGDVTLEHLGRDLVFQYQSADALRQAHRHLEQLPEPRAAGVEIVYLISFQVNEHDLPRHTPSHDVGVALHDDIERGSSG